MVLLFSNRIIRIRNQNLFEILSPDDIKSVTPKGHVELKTVDSTNVLRAKDFRTQQTLNSFLKFLQNGDWGIYACVEGKVVGHAWAVVNSGQSSKRIDGYMDVNQNEAFIHYCNVSEEYRGKNIFPLMISELSKQLFYKNNLRKILIDSNIKNQASMRGIEKAGFKFLRRKIFIQILNKLLY